MTIHTPTELRKQTRRLDRVNPEVHRVLAAMRGGAALHLTFRPSPQWALTTGTTVSDAAAKLIMARPGIVGVGDSLFGDQFAQTWRWVGPA